MKYFVIRVEEVEDLQHLPKDVHTYVDFEGMCDVDEVQRYVDKHWKITDLPKEGLPYALFVHYVHMHMDTVGEVDKMSEYGFAEAAALIAEFCRPNTAIGDPNS